MFEISKTALTMAEKRGFTVETSEKKGETFYIFKRDGKVIFTYKAEDARLAGVSMDNDNDKVQAFPDYLNDDDQVRDFIKNWPLNSGASDD